MTVPLRLLSNVSNSVYALAPSDGEHGITRRWGGDFQSEMEVRHDEFNRSVGRSIGRSVGRSRNVNIILTLTRYLRDILV